MINCFNMFKYLFNYIKLFSWITTIYIHERYYQKDIILYKCLLKTILSCGCIPIKFVQWIIPHLYLHHTI